MHGYLGRLLCVDLTAGQVSDKPLDPTYATDYIGGSGLAARYIYDMVDENTDPLGPDNPLCVLTGPLVGTIMPSAGRFSVCALSPLTGIWGEANSGGFFGPTLRFAGYDGILITGQSPEPVWLSIKDGSATLRSAKALWGLDSYETQARVKAELGNARTRVACIGQAGEEVVKMAAVMNDHGRAAARTGMGAVMGAKRLKAIAVSGQQKVPVAHPDTLESVVAEIHQDLEEDIAAMSLRLAGTAGYVDMGLMYGDMPIRYFQQDAWEKASDLSGVLMAETYQKRARACYRCPIACGRETQAPRYGLKRVDGPEYETMAALGSLLMIDDQEAVIYAGHLCNRYGMDTISVGVTLALACELAERGLLSAKDTDGLQLRYGDPDLVHQLITKMAKRKGFGDLLAEGSAALAAHVRAPELAATINKLEVPMHDPRAFHAMAATYALSPRGACHMQGDMYGVDAGHGPARELEITPGDRFDSSREKGRMTARQQAWRTLYNALTLCQFLNPGVDRLLGALNAITGWELDANELLLTGKRILTLKRLLNLRRGLSRDNERLPQLLQKPLSGGTEENIPDLDTLLEGAYAELGWDVETGWPQPETLKTLGLSDLDI